MTVTDCLELGIAEAAQRALDVAWDGAAAVGLSFDVGCLGAAFVPSTGWPEPDGFLPREVLKFIQIVVDARALAGIEVVEAFRPTTTQTSRRCSPLESSATPSAAWCARVTCQPPAGRSARDEDAAGEGHRRP
jgi:arginase family protein